MSFGKWKKEGHVWARGGAKQFVTSEEAWDNGKREMLRLLRALLDEVQILTGVPEVKAEATIQYSSSPNRVFVVHGHDDGMKQDVARMLEKLDFEAIVLHEQPNEGRTVIEKFSDYADVSLAVVLMSPDDVGYSRKAGPATAKPRARQNVILELGFFVGKLGRDRVFVLCKQEHGELEIPSDYSGILYIHYDQLGKWQFELVKELQACGYTVDANRLISVRPKP